VFWTRWRERTLTVFLHVFGYICRANCGRRTQDVFQRQDRADSGDVIMTPCLPSPVARSIDGQCPDTFTPYPRSFLSLVCFLQFSICRKAR